MKFSQMYFPEIIYSIFKRSDLLWVVDQWAVITLVPNTIHICVFLVSIVNKGTVVFLVQNLWKSRKVKKCKSPPPFFNVIEERRNVM